MRRFALILLAVAGCHAHVRPPAPAEPLGQDGEAWLYLQPFPQDARRLAFSIAGIEAVRSDGVTEPLALALGDVTAEAVTSQRLLGRARLAAGMYVGLQITFSRATLATGQGVADLLASKEPVRIDLPFTVVRGRAVVLQLALRPGQAREREFAFSAAFAATPLRPDDTLVEVGEYGTSPGLADVFVVDRRVRQVAAVIPTGREPQGIAVDLNARRAYVALAGEDQIQVLDLVTGDDLRRIPLRTGDRPREIALTPDGRTLVCVNPGSHTVAFVDPQAGVELDRVRVGEEPWALLLDRSGRRAYALNRWSSNLTVLDVANRAVVTTVTTDAEPLRAQLNRDGTRLYVIHRGSAYLNVYSVPDMAPVARMFIGLGASALKVDPRTDLVYVGRGDEDRIQLYDPTSLLPVDSIDVPGAVSYLAIDDVENTLVAVLPAAGRIAWIDLTRKRLLSTADVGRDPFRIVPVSERF